MLPNPFLVTRNLHERTKTLAHFHLNFCFQNFYILFSNLKIEWTFRYRRGVHLINFKSFQVFYSTGRIERALVSEFKGTFEIEKKYYINFKSVFIFIHATEVR